MNKSEEINLKTIFVSLFNFILYSINQYLIFLNEELL